MYYKKYNKGNKPDNFNCKIGNANLTNHNISNKGNSCENNNCNPCSFFNTKPNNTDKNCLCYINESNNILDLINCENNKSIENLEKANIAFDNANLEGLECELKNIYNKLNKLSMGINNVMGNLGDVIETLSNSTNPCQNDGRDNVQSALESQEEINKLINKLECSFDDTVACLKNECPPTSNKNCYDFDDCDFD